MENKKYEIKGSITVVENMRDYSQDPYFRKKAENAKKNLEKYGIPKEFESRIKKS